MSNLWNGPKGRDEEVLRRLKDAVLKAQTAHNEAQRKFDSTVNKGLFGMPHPDGTLRVQLAGRERSQAVAAYQKALRQYTDFLLHGVIPDQGPDR